MELGNPNKIRIRIERLDDGNRTEVVLEKTTDADGLLDMVPIVAERLLEQIMGTENIQQHKRLTTCASGGQHALRSIAIASMQEIGHIDGNRVSHLQEALRTLRAALARFPTDAFMQYSAALCCLQLGELTRDRGYYSMAQDLLLTILKEQPENYGVRLNMARTYMHLGELDKAENIVRQLASQHPSSAESLTLWGQILVQMAKHQQPDQAKAIKAKALQVFKSAERSAPGSVTPLVASAHLSLEAGATTKAIEYAMRACEISPSAKTFAFMAHVLGLAGRSPDAEEAYRRALVMDPFHLEALEGLAIELAQRANAMQSKGAPSASVVQLNQEAHLLMNRAAAQKNTQSSPSAGLSIEESSAFPKLIADIVIAKQDAARSAKEGRYADALVVLGKALETRRQLGSKYSSFSDLYQLRATIYIRMDDEVSFMQDIARAALAGEHVSDTLEKLFIRACRNHNDPELLNKTVPILNNNRHNETE